MFFLILFATPTAFIIIGLLRWAMCRRKAAGETEYDFQFAISGREMAGVRLSEKNIHLSIDMLEIALNADSGKDGASVSAGSESLPGEEQSEADR